MTRPGAGKFEANESVEISEFLYDLSPDDTLGEVENFGWYGLVTGIDEMFARISDGIQAAGISEFFDTKDTFIEEISPAYIVNEDNNGFFTYYAFSSSKSARSAWKYLAEDYLTFMEMSEDQVKVI